MNAELVDAVRSGRLVLFAGSGLSAGLGLPTWGRLVDHMADDLGYDRDIFRTLGDFWTLAEYYRHCRGSLGPLRSWMDTNWHAPGMSISHSEAHRLVVELDFPVVYTTNFDRWIERAYEHHGRPYAKVLDVDDLARVGADPTRTPIIKFHGDFDDDDSLVLTETHFLRRLELEHPLDVRLRSDLLGRSALFIGYSLTDPNIRRLLFKLRMAWETAGRGTRQPRSFLFSPTPNPVQEAVLGDWGVTFVTEDHADRGEALVDFLGKLLDAKNA